MNMESTSNSPDTFPDTMQQPRSSGGKKWLVTGCGCLLVLVLICAGGSYFAWTSFIKPVYELTTETIVLLEESETVAEVLGVPVTPTGTNFSQENNQSTLTINVSGPKGSGVVNVYSTKRNGFWERDKTILEANGQEYEIDSLAELDIIDLE